MIDVPDPVIWSACRAAMVATMALWLAHLLKQWLASMASGWRTAAFAAALGPLFVPDLLLGFTYRLSAARMVGFAAGTELLYAAVLVMRCLPVALVVHLVLPRPLVTRESVYLWDLLHRQTTAPYQWWWNWLLLRLYGPWQSAVAAWCLMALVTFQEFEMAALMQVDLHPVSWTVWLFDAHAAWQPLTDSLRMLRYPLAFETLLLIPTAAIVLNSAASLHAVQHTADVVATTRRTWWGGGTVAVLMIIALAGMPLLLNSELLLRSLRMVGASGAFLGAALEQTAVSLGFGMAAAGLTLVLGSWCLRARWRLLLLLPGLWGALTCSLFWLAVFQIPVLRPLYDSWLPLLFGLASANLPRAVIVLVVLRQVTDPAAVHSAVLLRDAPDAGVRRSAARLLWFLVDVRWLLAGVIIAHWCFWDVTTVAILRPVDLEPVITRLYNEMHYGRTEALALGTALACLATPLAALLVAGAWRAWRLR